MLNGTLHRFSGALLLFFLVFYDVASQTSELSSIRMMFYNVENFFDVYDDSLKEDNDFLPHGLMRWSNERYQEKVMSIYKVITAAGEWSPPALIGFCEVEKRSVLEDLVTNTYLAKHDFGIIHEESPDPRGIDVCLIYRRDLVNLLGYQYLLPSDLEAHESKTRSVLYSRWYISGDTVHIFLNHWPSRRGGVLAAESIRESIARMIKNMVDSIMKNAKEQAKIIIAGDFNCSPEDQEVLILMERRPYSSGLINLSEQYSEKGAGTYRYMGTWEMFDQVMISDGLLKCNHGICTSLELFRIFDPDFLLRKDPGYPGNSPFSTYRGYRYQGGYSDHLPVILDLMINRVNQAK
jgi:hypothetical protein